MYSTYMLYFRVNIIFYCLRSGAPWFHLWAQQKLPSFDLGVQCTAIACYELHHDTMMLISLLMGITDNVVLYMGFTV